MKGKHRKQKHVCQLCKAAYTSKKHRVSCEVRDSLAIIRQEDLEAVLCIERDAWKVSTLLSRAGFRPFYTRISQDYNLRPPYSPWVARWPKSSLKAARALLAVEHDIWNYEHRNDPEVRGELVPRMRILLRLLAMRPAISQLVWTIIYSGSRVDLAQVITEWTCCGCGGVGYGEQQNPTSNYWILYSRPPFHSYRDPIVAAYEKQRCVICDGSGCMNWESYLFRMEELGMSVEGFGFHGEAYRRGEIDV